MSSCDKKHRASSQDSVLLTLIPSCYTTEAPLTTLISLDRAPLTVPPLGTPCPGAVGVYWVVPHNWSGKSWSIHQGKCQGEIITCTMGNVTADVTSLRITDI